MRKSGKRDRGAQDSRRRQLTLFLAGVALGLVFFIFYRFILSPRPPHVKKTLEHRQVAPPAVVVAPKRAPPEAPKAKIAVVIDDFGYNLNNAEAFFNIGIPVTFSILPHRAYSKKISAQAAQRAYEAILHLPLEAHKENKQVKQEPATITTRMKKKEVLERLSKALDEVPGAIGVSNHQGSRATEDPALMAIIFEELKRRSLFFLDSVSTSKSVCKKAAVDSGIRYGQRSVFLDNSEDFEYIKGQTRLLVKKAKKSGSAIGIGHDREKTVAALARLMPEAQKEGVEFVPLSELIK
ncbi:MAG: divergent polysaccharide deacetylase family protein [Candidatus Omnitrophica bacterium]|nr:divergent polysaccharide deacetylase family protein [Candidatus Omnitrophota bacterium]